MWHHNNVQSFLADHSHLPSICAPGAIRSGHGGRVGKDVSGKDVSGLLSPSQDDPASIAGLRFAGTSRRGPTCLKCCLWYSPFFETGIEKAFSQEKDPVVARRNLVPAARFCRPKDHDLECTHARLAATLLLRGLSKMVSPLPHEHMLPPPTSTSHTHHICHNCIGRVGSACCFMLLPLG